MQQLVQQNNGSDRVSQYLPFPPLVRKRPGEDKDGHGFVAPWRFKSSRPHHLKRTPSPEGVFHFLLNHFSRAMTQLGVIGK